MRCSRVLPLLASLFVFAPACAREIVAHLQLERDANEIVHLLETAGIGADKNQDAKSREPRFNVEIAKQDTAAALSILEKHNLPKTRAPDTQMMFESGGLIPTSEQQRAKREVGIRGDIVNALRSVPRVVDVHVTVNIPEDNPLRDVNEAKPKPKAAVLLTYYEDTDQKPPLMVEDVQRFVQGAIPEITSKEVSVQMFPTIQADGRGPNGESTGPGSVPGMGCMEKERVIGIDVCKGHKGRVHNLMLGSVVVAGLLSGMVIFAVLRAMRYRKDLTRLTAQFEKVKAR